MMAHQSSHPSPQPLAPNPQVIILLGPARAGKTHQLVGRYREALMAGRSSGLDRVLWLAPSSRSVAAVRELLIARGHDACLSPGVMTFDSLADAILLAAKNRSRPIASALQRELLRRVIVRTLEEGALKFFADAARRSGFAELLAEHIRELKRHDISPAAYEKISATRGQSQQHQELARLYRDYERQLTSHQLIDRERVHSVAREALAKRACPRFHELDLVVADGFTDLTRTQLEIIQLLARQAKQLYISLPDDTDPATRTRPDLFAKTAATLADLEHLFPHLKLERLPARSSTWPTIDYITKSIFRHPKPAPSADALRGLDQIEIVEAAGAQDEIVQIARRIKQRLTAGDSPTKPSDILVIFRSVNEVAPRIEEVFERFGIPCSIETNRRIARAPVFRTLAALLRLDQEDWPFRRVVSAITNNNLAALDGAARKAAEWLVRDLQIASGKRKLFDVVGRLAAQPGSEPALSAHQAKRVQAAAAALPALTQIAAALDQLPKQATLAEWTAALANLLTTLAQPLLSADATAWQSIAANFAALERLDTWLGKPARKLSRSEMLATLIDVATREALPRSYDEVGRVRVLSAPAARAVTAQHLYLAGMSEQSFPAAVRQGRLATDAEYRFFASAAHQKSNAGPPATTAATRSQDEMLLFYEVLSRAEESLTISYAALDDKAQDLPPSPYVVELQRMFDEAGQKIHCTPPQLLPVPDVAAVRRNADSRVSAKLAYEGAYSLADWRVRAVAKAIERDGDRRLLAGIFSRADTQLLGHAIDAGIRAVHARAHGESFGPNEGLLTSPAVAARLAQRFGPQHLWSPSQWETYAACPFRFFLQAVLKLEPLGDLVLETDYTRRGSRLHHVLAAFHRQWPDQRIKQSPGSGDERTQFTAHLNKVIDDHIAVSPDGGIDAALLELDRRRILKWAGDHFDHHQKYDRATGKLGAAMTPAHLEFRFGSARPDDTEADPNSTSKIFELDIAGEPIRVTGQIDRIDVGTVGDQTVFNVIDYKSGRRASLKSDQLETGQQLQLPIYVEAAQLLLFDGKAKPLAAGYWSMGTGFDEKGALAAWKKDEPGPDWSATQAIVHALIREFVDGIRKGDFPVASRDDKCTSYCDFHLTCRIAQARSTGKLWWPETDDSKPPTAASNPQSEI